MVNDGPTSFLPEITTGYEGRIFRGTFSPNASDFYFFRKVSDEGENFRVYRVRLGDGPHTAVRLDLGDRDASSMYPVVSPDGEQLVFSSYRGENADLWAAPRDGSDWGAPTLLDASTAENYDASPWFDGAGTLRFTSTSPDWSTTDYYRSVPSSGNFLAPEEDVFWSQFSWAPEHHFWSGVVDPTGAIAVLEVSERLDNGSLSGTDLWISRRVDETWTPPAAIGGGINTAGTENFPTFTPSGSELVFVRDFSEFVRVAVGALR